MKVYRSNRVEALAAQLGEVLARPVSAKQGAFQRVMRPDVVVVQSVGMGRWLEMELAKTRGICANVQFPFPRGMVRQAVCSVVGKHPKAWTSWQPDALLWHILEALAAHIEEPPFEALARYLKHRDGVHPVDVLGTADGVLLAAEIASVFDRYLSYRPDMVLRWEQEVAGTDWQHHLWRTVRARMDTDHIASLFTEFQQAIAEGTTVDEERLPPRICLFGISTLPPFFLEAFSTLSHIRDVHLFVLCPSNMYWGDIRSKREQARALRQLERNGGVADLASLYLTEGNPLLASFGRLGRDFQVVLEGMDSASPYVEADIDLFEEPLDVQERMLHVLQSDVLNLRHRRSGNANASRIDRVNERLPSIQVHVCHGELRQVEAIRDNILARFEDNPELNPRDIVVMTPDIERFTPLIEAVFGDDDAQPRIPFRIADRTMDKDNPVAEFLLRLVSLASGRLTVTDVLDVLGISAVRAKFDISDDDVPEFERWIRKAGICWAENAADRVRHGQPADAQNTWRFGFDRLLLGVAMQGQGAKHFGDVLPYDDIEGGAAAVLGRVVDACESLFARIRSLRRARSVAAWSVCLKAALDEMLSVEERDVWQLQAVRDVLQELGQQAEEAGCHRTFDLSGIRALLSPRLQESTRAAGFLTGGVTFCALVPMRSIPFKVVYLMGMEDGAFPRKGRKTGFDRTHQHPRHGDRNPREEDRYLMLEAMLAAREAFVVTYSGFEAQTGAEQPASAPIDEWMTVVEEAFVCPPLWRVVHPLQAFSPRLFHPEHPVSHDRRLLPAAKQMWRDPMPRPPLYSGPVPPKLDEDRLALEDLIEFFQHPTKAFLYRRMGVYLNTFEEQSSDREPLEIESGLGSWKLKDAALRLRLTGLDWNETHAMMARQGVLPLGTSGKLALLPIQSTVDAIVSDAAELRQGESRSVSVNIALEGVRLSGRISGLYPKSRVVVQPSKASGKYTVGLWITHLALRASVTQERWKSALVHDGGTVTLGTSVSSSEAKAHLQTLAELYVQGQSAPVSFFPKTSLAYIEALHKSKGNADKALIAATKTWRPDFRPETGEYDKYHELIYADAMPYLDDFCLAGSDADTHSFAALSALVWAPYLGECLK